MEKKVKDGVKQPTGGKPRLAAARTETQKPLPLGPGGRSNARIVFALVLVALALWTASSFGPGLPESYRGGAFVGEHGSWNRQVLNGYKVIFVPFSGGKPNGMPQDVVTGFSIATSRRAGGRSGWPLISRARS
jgi:hypothetical protein